MKQIKKWQEPIYAIGGFGPGFIYQISLVYMLLYYRPALKLIDKGALIFAPAAAFAAATLIARILDGVVDIPIAAWTDNMKSRWGRRRPLMVLGLIPMTITFVLLWYPPITGKMLSADGHWGNAIYIAAMSSAFFFCYTLITVPYLAALSEIVQDENSRVRVASWQTVFNTGGFVLTFVVAPIMFEKYGIRGTIWLLVPTVISFIGPIFVIKEDSTAGDEVVKSSGPPEVGLWQSIKMSMSNRTFRIYIVSFATFFFGLQFFLGGIAFMALDMMGLSQGQLGMMNGAAFAPVPIMLLVFNFIARKKGAKWGFQLALLLFALAMFLYPLAWTRLNFPVPPFTWGVILGFICSFSVGIFFTIPYAFPAHIAAVEAEETGKDRAGMYFAIQGLINQGMGSLSAAALALLLTWQYGVVAIGPITGVLAVVACILFNPYPLGKPSGKS